jgi:transcription initiation factor TFIIIB Brf1 subunit/transcription initiation factor TFIIB
MECRKCQGLMVAERVTDGLTHLNEWRCLNCGCILDPVILQHKDQSDQRSQVAAAA